jgi:hypothetical protein
MTKFPAVYSDQETKILMMMYENPELSFDTFTLTARVHGITVASAEFADKFSETVKATEQLIVKGLVDGTQLKHTSLGLYFSEMKLKYKGKQEAIQERGRVAEFNRKLPDLLKEADAVAMEITEAQTKPKK